MFIEIPGGLVLTDQHKGGSYGSPVLLIHGKVQEGVKVSRVPGDDFATVKRLAKDPNLPQGARMAIEQFVADTELLRNKSGFVRM